jgi:hypothetical protein
MTRVVLLFLSFFIAFSNVQAQLPPKEAYPFYVLQIHSGHSLTDPLFYPHWPGQYVNLMTEVLGTWSGDMIGKSTIPGSSLSWRWDNPPCCGAPDARHDIDDWELLSITQSVPLYYEGGSTQQWYIEAIAEQRQKLSDFTNNAWQNGNGGAGAPTLLWTTWTNIDNSDGPWREMLDILGEEWENMQDFANDNLLPGSPPVYLIPGHKMMAKLYDDIQLGIVPDVDHISDFFGDNIHTNELGAYAIAMIHYACIYNMSPVGLPNNLLPNAPGGTPIPSVELAAYLQNMIWEVVTSYPPTGIYQFLNTDFSMFDATESGKQVYVQFQLEAQEGLESIELQHSDFRQDFRTIHVFDSQPETAHSFKYYHDNPLNGKNYYRIKLKSLDGILRYSSLKVVEMRQNGWQVYPNPADNVVFVNGSSQDIPIVRIKDMQGKILLFNTDGGPFDVARLMPGLYIMEVSDSKQIHVERFKLVKR